MWEIFKAELQYTRFAYFVFFAAIVLLVLFNVVSTGGERIYVLWFILAMALNYWNARRIREKRDFQLVQIPVGRRDVGRARALMLVLTPAAGLFLYAIVRGAAGRAGLNFNLLGFIYGLVVIIFAALFMFRDRFVGTKSLVHGKIALIFILGALFAAGVVMMLATEDAMESGVEPPWFLRAFDAVIRHNPLGHPLYVAGFVAVSLILAYVSTITFQRRKTNVE